MTGKILICGGSGFIGRNLVNYYKDRPIRATYHSREIPFIHPNIEWVKCDLTNKAEVEKIVSGVDVILQYAATTSGAKDIVSTPYIHVTDNAIINSLLFKEAFIQNIKQVVFPSCTIMYPSSQTALKESDFSDSTVSPQYFGAAFTKLYLEQMAKFYSNIGNTKFTVIRQSNIYGPYDKFDLDKSHVFGATITKVMKSDTNHVSIWGTGKEKRDWLHVSDLIRLIDSTINLQTSKFELINAGIGKAYSINTLVKRVINISGKKLKIQHDITKPSIPTSLFLNCNLAKEKFNWSPEISLDEGIKQTIKWYKDNI